MVAAVGDGGVGRVGWWQSAFPTAFRGLFIFLRRQCVRWWVDVGTVVERLILTAFIASPSLSLSFLLPPSLSRLLHGCSAFSRSSFGVVEPDTVRLSLPFVMSRLQVLKNSAYILIR
ncbi:unnamed protein product [Lactuca virosa]|uniref:Uncharacterized protein n=1 Tax=Lactuca virosa TaxID=75947 RepID=A0AAU9PLT0_9ASTR|nr:unnamed protein product [Lactuca virosa]